MNEREAHLPAFATDELHKYARENGGNLDKAWEESELCGAHHEGKKELMFARVKRWLREAEFDRLASGVSGA